MALLTAIGAENIPKGAVRLRESDALEYQKSIIRDWNKESDVFFLRYGRHLAFGCVFISSALVFSFYRKQLLLRGNASSLTITFPIVFVPSAIVGATFDKRVTNRILLMKANCPMCLQMRYLVNQITGGLIYPIASSTILLSFFAEKFTPLQLPPYHTEPKKFFKAIYQLSKPGALRFQGLAALHLLVSLCLPYLQQKELMNVTQTLLTIYQQQNLES